MSVIDRRYIVDYGCEAEVLAWLREHGLDPDNTKCLVVVDDGTITAVEYLRDADGKRYLTTGTSEVAVRTRPVTPKRALPVPEAT